MGIETESFLSPSSLRPGSRLYGRFLIQACVGRGAVGVVYRAIDTELRNTPVALKCPHARTLLSEKALSRLRREVLLSRKLTHPHIVGVYELISTDGEVPVVVMEHVDGGTLESLIRSSSFSSIPYFEKLELLRQIASALAYAHDHGVVHRDIKPQNVLLSTSGSAKIADFGLGRCFEDDQRLTRTGASLGTPHYMAPEQFRGEEAGPTADMYSFGILAYELVSGEKPYAEDIYLALALKHTLEPLPRLPVEGAALPSWLPAVLEKCTAKKPEERFSSMHEVVDIFERACSHLSCNACSEAVARMKRARRKDGTRAQIWNVIRRCFWLPVLWIFIQVGLLVAAEFSPDMRARVATVALVAEHFFERDVTFPLKHMLGVDSYHTAFSEDIFRAIAFSSSTDNHVPLKALIWSGADLTVRDAMGETPLMKVVRKNPQMMVFMLEMGADINARGTYGRTAFQESIVSGAFSGEYKSILSKVDFSLKDENGWNALHYAAYNGRIRALEVILADARSRPYLFDRDLSGLTPLLLAVKFDIPSQVDVVRVLLENGADTSETYDLGKNALSIAIINGFTEAALRILDKADSDVVTSLSTEGKTPLMYLLARKNLTTKERDLAELLRVKALTAAQRDSASRDGAADK